MFGKSEGICYDIFVVILQNFRFKKKTSQNVWKPKDITFWNEKIKNKKVSSYGVNIFNKESVNITSLCDDMFLTWGTVRFHRTTKQ